MLGVIVWCIILIVIGACIMPWWVMPTIFAAGFLWSIMQKKYY